MPREPRHVSAENARKWAELTGGRYLLIAMNVSQVKDVMIIGFVRNVQ